MLTIIPDKAAFVLEVHRRLYEIYGVRIEYFHDLDPLSELVTTLLSHRTKNRDSAQAFQNLRNAFGSWENVRDADVDAIMPQLKPCTWPEQKAPRVKEVLRLITEKLGQLNLDFLGGMEVTAARQWLEELPGVGPKSSAAVISFSTLRGKALPVDSHHFRVASRLGIIDAKIGEGKANRVLEDLLPPNFTARETFDHHQVMMRHGQKVCLYYKPDCAACIILDLCSTGQSIVAKKGN
ncbi:endonuclease III domain-containing protein [Mucilaginibacter terrae]|uniref:endonuclease III domain-containing protein n=1 Tax=Mucilaginibacter terrae TaxID=1955052 RepID=UPI0036276D34